jgi:hypothetical protein
VDRPGQLIGPLDRVVEDLHECLDHRLEGGDIVVPDDDRPQVLGVEERVDIGVVDDRVVDGGLVVENERHGWIGSGSLSLIPAPGTVVPRGQR